jgi:glycosyltransferase involved in cell wall biosynthesis
VIVALVPGYNEGPRIGEVVRGAAAQLPVLVVDDGSHDDTAAQALAAGATVIEQKPNQGKGAALRAGFRRALADGADAVLTLDADGQHDPAEIPAFLSAWEAEPRPDLVIGRRNFRAMPPIRRLSNVLGGRAFSWAVGRPIPDNQSAIAS